MAEKFRFFDPVMDENGNYDREYNAQEFVEYFSALVTTGVMKGAGNQLAVTADNASMVTTLDTGIAFILGRYYENDAPLQHIHDTETVGKQRIDRIVIRMDNNAGSRYVRSFVKKGVASTTPIPPALTQNDAVYEISVAQVRVVGGQTFIQSENVVDERGTDDICPYAGSKILPNFDDVALNDLINSVGQPSGIAELNVDGKVIDANGNLVEGKVKSVNGLIGDVVIIESGSNANGEYVKFSDGTLICYGVFTTDIFYSSSLEKVWAFPHEFTKVPVVVATMDDWILEKAECLFVGTKQYHSCRFRAISLNVGYSNGDFLNIHATALGRWK